MDRLSQPTRKRRRPAYSCTECRRRKVRCDRNQPCNQCTGHDVAFACTYEEHPRSLAVGQQKRQIQRTPEELPSPDTSLHSSATSNQIRGTVSKTRVFGRGHWMNTVARATNHGPQDKIAEKVNQCKQLSRDVKNKRPSRGCLPADLPRSFPGHQVMGELIELYFATFESCYRILNRPSFQKEYEGYINDSEPPKSPFMLQLLLVMVLASTIHGDANIRSQIMTKSSTWIHIAQSWLSAPLEKDRLTLEGIQTNCLLLLARQVTRIGADLVWISAGSLIRMAMQMGLHQDPDYLEEMSRQQEDIRRRLWYTILEMNVQTALDSGMLPMITDTDYNTHPPSNVSDNDLEGTMREQSQEGGHSNHVSFQSLLADSLSLRLRATRVINSLQDEPPYDQVLALGNELASACSNATIAIEQASTTDCGRSVGFASSFCNHLLRRFPLCLHYQYAVKAKKSPIYSYSQKVCLEAAQDLVLFLEDDQYYRLLLTGGGMFRDIITRGALLLFLELNPEPQEDNSSFARRRRRARQEPLLQDARRVVQYAKDRMRHGETNVKVYVCLSMMMAQAESHLDGLPPKEAISKALHDSLDICHRLLEQRVADACTSPTDPVLESWASSGMVGQVT
ncbi:transcription factor domain-containing protein [Aspergillus alliaceus]|uniref:transcription factor domain-containing protein n=1 Tax=Petromyces alliaceus TaxID=209559 RepID=UPI0012A524AA|nr:fungal-specific transcription factor domain-containing protein [Aspergillus alliaceus]KAB8231585.1 fungal-specific transcription factor domain-containing protein [Aspergillus alliaceus]